jgi:hypothetical protein
MSHPAMWEFYPFTLQKGCKLLNMQAVAEE